MMGTLVLRPAARAWLAGVLALLLPTGASAQFGKVPAPGELVKVTAGEVSLGAGGEATATFRLTIAPTWHINANPPFPDYMIPTRLVLEPAAKIAPGEPAYPEPHAVKLGFDDSDIFVYDGEVEVRVPLRAAADATAGATTLSGKLTFQACNDQICLAPATLPVTLAVTVVGGKSAGAVEPPSGGTPPAGDPGAAPSASGAFSTGPPPGGPVVDNPLARALEKGSLATFIALFLIGLALNLTPCVYPMLGVTVSIFGARGATPPHKAFGLALVYVMGIALMYSTLGLVAAYSGGLFGAALQSPVVLVVIGGLLVALSLSMFGLYEFELPARLRLMLGGQTGTGMLGVFASGLLVGVFAAPCIGPPIVALLAIVGQKGDPVFGFTSFFILSLGLGAPYLVLGTFSNLLSNLPRSGEWMVWVKKVFGVVLFSIGAFYVLLAFAPRYAYWVAPVALLAGGLYLGFFEKSKGRTAAFGWIKRVGGAIAVIAGAFMLSALGSSKGIAFTDVTTGGIEQALGGEKPLLVEFSADWCVPCHELEEFTFTDDRVIAAARDFHTFAVDLTRYDSPEAERWRQRYQISGVPTILFLTPTGDEVRAARVEGFLPPEALLERMQIATAAGQTAGR
jgi:thiol:disulfide interchange protein DsbD